jgi:hypothetical protein
LKRAVNIKTRVSVLAAPVIASVILLSFVTWQWADDFCSASSLGSQTILQRVMYGYRQWDGRIFVGFVSGVFRTYLPRDCIIAFWSIFFILVAVVINEIICFEFRATHSIPAPKLISVAILTAALWYGMKSHISETVYWASGGWYSLANFVGILWCYCLIRIVRNGVSHAHGGKLLLIVVALFLFGVLAGMCSQNLSPGLLALCGMSFVTSLIRNRKMDVAARLSLLSMIAVLIGTSIIVFAPGNFVRAAYAPDSFQFDLNILKANYVYTLMIYLKLSPPLMLLSAIVGAIYFCFLSSTRIRLARLSALRISRDSLLEILERIKWLVAALATIAPFMLVPFFAANRSAIFFMTFAAIFIMEATISLLGMLFVPDKNSSKPDYLYAIGYMAALYLLLFHLCVISSHIYYAAKIKKQMQARHDYLNSMENRGRDVIVKPVSGVVPFSTSFRDITTDKTDWMNTAVANYYRLNSIVLK